MKNAVNWSECFANSNNIDLDKAIRKSFDKVMKRDEHRFDAPIKQEVEKVNN
jgi:NTP pyrophosphatase (non-canonical NTP hydrolase)